jgi:hypothetical protein
MPRKECKMKSAELVIVGGTVPGIAAATRAARAGIETQIVMYDDHLDGMFTALGAIETHYPGARSPFAEEFKRRVLEHYRTTYGAGSEQYRVCTTLDPNNPMITFEPSVAERILNDIVSAEPRIQLLKRYYPIAVELARDVLRAVIVKSFDDGRIQQLDAEIFIDATYEGDLAAVAGVPYRVGREARAEYGESHAGRIFTRFVPGKFPIAAAQGKLNLLPKWTTMGLYAGSTGEGDDNIQDYSYRLCLSGDPDNRRLPEKPEGYDRLNYLGIVQDPEVTETKPYALHHRFLAYKLRDMIAQDHVFHGHALPNRKRSWNATNFPGAGKAYPDGDWETRRRIARSHVSHALGILYFLQNDDAVPEGIRAMARQWGLARDEFVDNDNIPYQMYVREARRIYGRYTFTEHDNVLTPGLGRAPIHADSIAVTEFPLDSLPCTTDRMPGTLCDGQFFQMEISRPGQVPYGILLPERIQNLLIPTAASVTHVAWATIRQTPTLIQIGEAAGIAAVLAHETQTLPGKLRVEQLQQKLVRARSMITFFNEFDMATDAPWVSAVQYLGAKGFFESYDARPNDPMTRGTARVWAETAAQLARGRLDANAQARKLMKMAVEPSQVRAREFIEILNQEFERAGISLDASSASLKRCGIAGDTILTRAEACRLIYTILDS